MLKAEANFLIESYLKWLREGMSIEEVNDNIIISTPFLDRHNDEIEIFLEKKNDDIRLSDDSYTIHDLQSSGMELSKSRRQHLQRILNGFGINLEGDELWVAARAQDFPQKKHYLLQAILAVNDLYITAKEEVSQFFREDVEAYLRDKDIPMINDFKFSGKSGFDHHFDIGLPATKSRPERILQTINTLRKDTVTSIAFMVQDVRNMRPPNSLGAFAMINDREKKPEPELISALQHYDITPLLWSDRESALEKLVA